MADILLTHGYFLADDEKERQIMKPYPPLGLLYLSAYLKRCGFAVEVFDSTFSTHQVLNQKLADAPGGTVGIYSNLMTRGSVLAIIAAAKQSGWRVILGGPESANYVDEYLAAGADCIVLGEGEHTLAEVLPALAARGPHRLQEVAGIAYMDEAGKVSRTPGRSKAPDLDALPWPDREAINHQLYLDAWKSHHGASSINLITARGCPYLCNWCSHSVYGYSHRRRSPANVAEEVQWIVERYNPDQLWYADDVFTISHPWLQTYVSELKQRGLHRPFETITRADRLQTEASARALRDLGCYRIWIGSESGSQRILDAMQRGVTVEQVQRAVRLAKDQGIEVGMFLMWGYEGEEIEDIAATVEHVKTTNPDIFFTTVSYPIKGTPYFDRVSDRVESPISWSQATDRDFVIRGRSGREYYRLADQWLKSEVEAARMHKANKEGAARLMAAANDARLAMQKLNTRNYVSDAACGV
jgi:radical SAM superfamily enzyme YgiQ (UPF0313 family)